MILWLGGGKNVGAPGNRRPVMAVVVVAVMGISLETKRPDGKIGERSFP